MPTRPDASVTPGARARLILLGASPLFLDGVVSECSGERLVITLDRDVVLPESGAVIVELTSDEPRKLKARLVGRHERRLELAVVAVHRPEAREYPRVGAIVEVRYRQADAAEVAPWLRGEPLAGVDGVPEEVADVSAVGLAIRTTHSAQPGDLFLLELTSPDAALHLRCVGQVVRVSPPAEGASSPENTTFTLAIRLVSTPPDVSVRLAELTLRTQDALLFGAG